MGSDGALPGVAHQRFDGPVVHDLVDMTPAGPVGSGNRVVSRGLNGGNGS